MDDGSMDTGKTCRVTAFADGQILPCFRGDSCESPEIGAGAVLDPTTRMASKIIVERAFSFACRIVKLCERLWTRGPAARRIADQLFGCGTSIGANAEEAEGAQ